MSGKEDAEKRDEVLKRLLKTPPSPKKKPVRQGDEPFDSPPPDNDDPKALLDWAARNIQK